MTESSPVPTPTPTLAPNGKRLVDKPELFSPDIAQEHAINLGVEITEFERDLKARKIIAELLRPLMEEADQDRQNAVIS
jgi:hypothetical protein